MMTEYVLSLDVYGNILIGGALSNVKKKSQFKNINKYVNLYHDLNIEIPFKAKNLMYPTHGRLDRKNLGSYS